MGNKANTLIVKPGGAYLLVAAILFAMVLAAFLAIALSPAVRSSDDPAESLHVAFDGGIVAVYGYGEPGYLAIVDGEDIFELLRDTLEEHQ